MLEAAAGSSVPVYVVRLTVTAGTNSSVLSWRSGAVVERPCATLTGDRRSTLLAEQLFDCALIRR